MEKEIVESYANGEFSQIESPIDWSDCQDWHETVRKANYYKCHNFGFSEDEGDLEVYKLRREEKGKPWYFVVYDLGNEGRTIFMDSWKDVSLFIKEHGAFIALRLLQDIQTEVTGIRKAMGADLDI